MSLPLVTILASLDPLVRERAVTTAVCADPGLVVVRHELETLDLDGCVHRLVQRGGVTDEAALPVDSDCCLSCLLREDTKSVLADLTDRTVLLVPPRAVEPASVAVALDDAGSAHVTAIVAAIDASRLESRLESLASVGELEGLGDDPRTVAELLARQLDHADAVLHAGVSDREAALIAALSGDAPQRPVDDRGWLSAGRHDHRRFRALLQPGVPRPSVVVDHAGVQHRRWCPRRPLHPQRLVDLLEGDEVEGLVRAHGWLWVATRPATVLELEAAEGGYELAAVDAWLDAVEDHSPAHPDRLEHALRTWHPYYGDRGQDLALTTLDRDLDDLVARLDACLLTDQELAEGQDAWRGWPDPLTPWLGEEAELLDPHPEERR